MTEEMTEVMTELRAENMSAAVSGKKLIKDVSFTLKGGELIALLGPNGAGKSTALRAALGLVTLRSGTSYLGGENVKTLSPISRARRAAYLPQTRPLAWPNRVKDIVALGRFSHYVNNGGGALVVLHELTLAAQYADKLIFMKNGEVVSSGAPDDILSSDLLADIYGIKADVNGRSVTIHGAL